MNELFVRRWIEALRSGVYRQTRGAHKRVRPDGDSYCVMGVGYVLAGGTEWHRVGESPDAWGAPDCGIIPSEVDAASGIEHSELFNLAVNMNDLGWSFSAIADYLEKMLPPAERKNFARELMEKIVRDSRISTDSMKETYPT